LPSQNLSNFDEDGSKFNQYFAAAYGIQFCNNQLKT